MADIYRELKLHVERIENMCDGAPHGLAELREENSKLRYQLDHLTGAYNELINCNAPISVKLALGCFFDYAVRVAYPQLRTYPDSSITPCTKFPSDHYQYNSCMAISKLLNNEGNSVNPVDVATNIIKRLPVNPVIGKATVAGPGFINVALSRRFIGEQVADIILKGVRPPKVESKRVVVDMSSPNVAKEMHVGHLRSTIIGECIANICDFLGHFVLRVNHIGDWGTQFGMLLAHLEEIQPDYDQKVTQLCDLEKFYKESKLRFDGDQHFKSKSYECVVKLQNGDAKCTKGWKMICDVSRDAFESVYKRLEVKNLIERGESFYQSRMIDVVNELKNRNCLVEDEGRLLLWVPGCTIPLTVVKSDGGFNYDTSDLATIKQRLFEEKADLLLYVVDSGQATHLNTIFAAAQFLGWLDPLKHRVEHIAFGLVLGEDGKKFKSRSGDTVKLKDLLDEGIVRASERKLDTTSFSDEEIQSVHAAVAYGCIRYADLSHSRLLDFVFSFDKMLDDKGNTAVYLLYAYARIRSIARNAGVDNDVIKSYVNESGLVLQHDVEWKLAMCILRFNDVILKIYEDFMPHTLCSYLYELSTTFTEFYAICYCIEKTEDGKKIHMERLALCEAVALIMHQCFKLLGIRCVEKM